MPARGDDPLQRVVGSVDLNGAPGDEIVLQNDQTGAITVQVSRAVRFVALQPDADWRLAAHRGADAGRDAGSLRGGDLRADLRL